MRLQLDPEDFDGSRDRPPRGAKSGRLRAVLLAVGVVACAGALWGGYGLLRHRSGGTATIPILHPDDRPIKVAPTDRGSQDSVDRGMWVLDPHRPQPGVEQLLPPPETPMQAPKPEPPPAVTDTTPVPAAPPSPPAAPATALPPPVAAAPVPAVTSSPAPKPSVSAPAPKAPAVTPPAVTAASPAPGSKGHRLQLGALRSNEAAQAEWERLKHAQSDLLGKLPGGVVRVDLGKLGIYYRIVAGPIADADRAEHVCAALKQRKIGCILAKP